MKINIHNSDKIEAALTAANGKAAAWTITEASQVEAIADEVEEDLKTRDVRVLSRIGTQATYSPPGPSANAYKSACISTRIVLERFQSGWFLTEVSRTEIYPKQSRRLGVAISSQARADMTRKFHAL